MKTTVNDCGSGGVGYKVIHEDYDKAIKTRGLWSTFRDTAE